MHNNFYFLRQLSPQIEQRLEGLQLMTAWSQEKDELVLGFAAARGKIKNYKEFFIKVILFPDFSSLYFSEQFERAKKNSAELFSELNDLTVLSVKQFKNERALGIFFENDYTLVFKLFGNRSNAILFKNDEVIDLFHNKLVADNKLSLSTLDREIDQSHAAFLAADNDYKKLYPTLGKTINEELGDELTNWQKLSETIAELEKPNFHLCHHDFTTKLLLIPFGETKQVYTDPIEAINAFYISHTKVDVLDKEKADILRKLNKEKRQTELYLKDAYRRLDLIENEARHEEIGHIIMANLHQIPARTEKIELFDFYRNKQVVVRLKVDLSPQKNAENFYRKAKNEKIEIDKIIENIEHREHILATINEHIEAINSMEQLKALRNYLKQKKLTETKSNQQNRNPHDLFRFENCEGFDIFIGRNAKNNDLLTQQFAFKEDLWLHARDIQGSHVIIKYKAGKTFPTSVIERAAGLAAWHSKKRNEGLAAVIVTKKKFVRKPKGLPEGAVVLDREEVIMVEPKA
jgi:predicted ribosome quality control (RQC) complex YloA/Tae2 family protein